MKRPPPTNQPAAAQPRRLSLRALARELGVNHSSLSAAVHDGRLTHGVLVDGGRVVVTDADAAAENWRGVRVLRPLEMLRWKKTAQAHATRDGATVLWDEAMGCEVTAVELFTSRDALSLLVTALAFEHREEHREAFSKRISKQLRDLAELHGADEDDIALAERELQQALVLLADEES